MKLVGKTGNRVSASTIEMNNFKGTRRQIAWVLIRGLRIPFSLTLNPFTHIEALRNVFALWIVHGAQCCNNQQQDNNIFVDDGGWRSSIIVLWKSCVHPSGVYVCRITLKRFDSGSKVTKDQRYICNMVLILKSCRYLGIGITIVKILKWALRGHFLSFMNSSYSNVRNKDEAYIQLVLVPLDVKNWQRF